MSDTEVLEIDEYPGDWVDIDALVEKYREMGYEASYENLKVWSLGFLAVLTVTNGTITAKIIIHGSDAGHFIEDIEYMGGVVYER